MQQYKLVIFDWDGTLMDSVPRIVSSMQTAAGIMNLPVPTKEQAQSIIGLSLPQACKQLFPVCDKDQITQLIAHYRYQYIKKDSTTSPLFEFAHELLSDLAAQNKLMAVATGKARDGLERVMNTSGLKHFFHTSRCADEANSKPDPQMILSILKELNVNAKEANMIGDTSFDLEMANRAGVDSIGVAFGAHSKEMLALYKPKAIVNSLLELQAILNA